MLADILADVLLTYHLRSAYLNNHNYIANKNRSVRLK